MEKKKNMKKSNAAIPPAAPKINTGDIWEEFSNRLFTFIRKRIKDEDDARDILQDVFVKIHQKGNSVKDSDKLVGWIFQLTRNAITDFYRSQKKGKEIEPAFLESEESEWYTELSCCVEPFINRLEAKEKELLMAVEMEGKKQLDISEELGIPYSTLKTNVQRARKNLKKMLVDCCSNVIVEKNSDTINGSCGNC